MSVLTDRAQLGSNPFAKIRKLDLETSSRRELTLEELHIVLDRAKGELKTLLRIGTFTGLRLGDCCTLERGDVDLTRGLIRRVPNKTRKRSPAPVVIGIPQSLHSELASIPLKNRCRYVVPTFADLYSYRNTSGRPVKQPEISKRIQMHFESCGIRTHRAGTGYHREPNPKEPGKTVRSYSGKRAVVDVGFHSLRHTYVSLQAERGTPLAVVQAIVGHGNPAMTRHYTHIGEQAAKDAALVLDSRPGDASEQATTEPLPRWARDLVETLSESNVREIRDALLGGRHPGHVPTAF